jgi:nicotinate phosphoribosyltransferase
MSPEEESQMIVLDDNRQPRKAVPEATQSSPESAAEHQRLDELLDEGLKETFPASDPVAVVQRAPERPKAKRRRRLFKRD